EPPLLDPPDSETAADRTAEIAGGLRCPVCQGLSVSDSNADAARAMHDRIAELVSQGYTEEQIVDYFVGRYGAWVRLEPPREGLNWLIWVGPVVLFVLGAGLVARQVGGQEPAPAAVDAPAPRPVASPYGGGTDYRGRVLAELGEAGRSAEGPTRALEPASDPRARILAELGRADGSES
ncbi:MAG: cytochrome c-type biogenesis protein CcmH, partial [Myxococcota bacterium]|nr:cytochrome c-type biogenesis protein CcmH [Myxococcota bacterium]